MNEIKLETDKFALSRSVSLPDKWARNFFFKFAEKLQYGQLVIIEDGRRFTFGQKTELSAEITLNTKSVYRDFVLGGSLGVAESYMRGEWDSPNLTLFIRLFARNMELVNSMDSGFAKLASPLLRGAHWLNRNTKKGSQKNIEAHYDLGNDFFETFLDESMMYSAAIFAEPDMTLKEAQDNKLKTICDKLQLKPQDHLLEIGTGWGAMAIFAAEHYGCRVTTTTLSKEQKKMAEQRIREKGLEEKITVLLEDYRDLQGTFDKLVSVEMVEAVGHEYLPEYFESCSRLLTPKGLFLMQVITIPDQRYDRARKDIDFIKRYIFPGSCIPSVERVMNCVSKKTDMRLLNHQDYTRDYAKTLGMWHENLLHQSQKVVDLTSERFMRMWRFYFSYCEGGFEEFAIGSAQMVFAKPQNTSAIK
jgi:cyclopropane-fatty-acyl-phospholipid synthase